MVTLTLNNVARGAGKPASHQVSKVGSTHHTASTGAATLMQFFGSAFKPNVVH
jgi:hypothetical protein